jgi:putative inorganic carbon (HCO3(-)) transporter
MCASRVSGITAAGWCFSRERAFAPNLRQIALVTARPWDSTDLQDLRLKPLWRDFKGEGVAFWLLCAYLMFEYVRPQSIYKGLEFLPWTTATMMAAALAVLAAPRSVRVASPANGFLLLFSGVIVLSSITAYRPEWSYSQYDGYFLWLIAYWLIVRTVTTERRMLMMILAFVLFNLKMTQFSTRAWISIGFGFRAWGTGGGPGWFQNSGEFGIEMCVFFPIVTYLALGLQPRLPKWKFLMLLGIASTALIGMVVSASRGALFGGAAVMAFMALRSKYRVRALFAAAVVGSVFFFAIPAEQAARLSASGTDNTSVSRLTYWRHGIQMTNDFPVLGVGYGNWVPYYRDHFEGRVQVCHNIFVQAAAELGYTGLIAFLLLIACTFVVNSRSRALAIRAGPRGRLVYNLANGFDGALIGYMVSGFFVTVLYYPYFWINLAMTVALSTVARQLPVAELSTSRASSRVWVATPTDLPLGHPEFQPAPPHR